jgi:hypothetical protein
MNTILCPHCNKRIEHADYPAHSAGHLAAGPDYQHSDDATAPTQFGSALRTTGVVCVALGMLLLVMSALPMVLAEDRVQFFFGLGVAVLLALPLILLGVFLTRRAAAQAGPDGEAAASAALLQRTSRLLEGLQDDNVVYLGERPSSLGKVDPHGSFMERTRAFDLNTVTAAGWLLVLTTAGFMVGAMIIAGKLLPPNMGPLGAVLLFPGIALAVGLFYLGQLLLKAVGIPVVRNDNPPDPPEPE